MEKGKQRTTKGTKGSVEGQQSSQEESKLEVMGSSPPTKDDDLYTMVVSALNGKDSTEETTASSDDSKLESHDVGYSSGGQSNEEVEYSITETTQEVKTTKILVKETQHTTISVKKDDTLEASVSEINDSTFTNVSSLPSAEESPYQAVFGNDSSHTQEDQEPNGEDSEKYEEALSSPSKRFYRMTSVEEEFAAENRGSNTEEMTQGYKSGSESDTQSNAKVRTRLDFLIQDLEHRLEEDTKPRSRTSSASAFGFDDEDSSSSLTSDEEHVDTQNNNSFIENLDTFEDYNHTLDTYKSHSKRSSDEKSESLAVQANSDSDHHQEVTQDDELDGAPNYDLEQAHIPNSRESVERLVRQAESFVRDGDFNIQTNRWTETSGKRRRRRKKKDTSTDSSANDNAGNYVESSCDASSEYTSDSESSSSNEENLYSSVIFKETTVTVETQNEGHVDSVTAQGSSLSATSSPNREVPHGVKMRRKTDRHKQNGRPWSVTELYELTNRLDFSPFSISEGALDALGGSQPDSLNKVTASGTELCSWRGATLHKISPHPKRKHHTKLMKMKRSVSESEKLSQEPQVGSSESPREDNKSLSEHETLYAMVAGALDAREHAGSSQEERSQYSLHTGQLSAVSGEGNQSDLGDLVDTEKRDDSDKDSDDTDELLNSTVESFSEHAWDPYQDPPYQVVTSDDNEEKLDDSHLTWENEDNFEFDDDYIKDSGMFSAEFLSAMQPKQSTVDSALDGMATSAASNGYPSPSGYSGDSSRVDDSDSDMEDFQHVINESAKQIQVTETSLKKQRRDAMDTGLCMDPSKYAELVATCETNLRCLQVIIEHLNAGKSLVGLTEEDVNRVHEIMTCWKDLHNLAVDKQSKSRQLSAIHHEMQMVHKYLRDLENGLEQSNFDDIKAVEERIKYLQEAKLSISEQKSTLTSVDMRVSEFAEQNTDINMLRFKKECTAMCSRFKDIETRTLTRTAELQNLLLAWYDYSETSKELDYLLSQQRQHIQLMQAGQQILVMNEQEKAEAAIDLKNMLIELDGYEAKMASIRQLSSQLLPLCSTDTQTDIRASVGTLSNQLDALKHDCKRMVASLQASETTVDRIEENMEISPEAEVFVVGAEGLEAVGASDDVGLRQRKMEVDSEIESAVAADVPMETEEVVRESIPVASATVAAESSKVRPVSRWIGRLAFCRRILKVAIPLQILLILLFGLAMLLEPDCCEYFNNFRLTFAPQLRYVRGPPPI
ncbi:uncharacterized protein LOC106154553 [Lingula anatina]|uniref:Uncharacterized protein LOC106154553 n=1 Tax=Lingula anatina TaxID=7574 RepID=A0A1S3HEG0_LINAN|nr:uncharacterized protein LOC106154553 [Lingula anatina]|eukprot:XP_013384395.1 uncharacterized protein LOC106154553 [Lingula anatina]